MHITDLSTHARAGSGVEDEFALDVRVVQDDGARPAGEVPCDTSNGCATTCASSCNSAV
jgi:FxLD family lantipeptide